MKKKSKIKTKIDCKNFVTIWVKKKTLLWHWLSFFRIYSILFCYFQFHNLWAELESWQGIQRNREHSLNNKSTFLLCHLFELILDFILLKKKLLWGDEKYENSERNIIIQPYHGKRSERIFSDLSEIYKICIVVTIWRRKSEHPPR